MKNVVSVDKYLNDAPIEIREELEELRKIIKSVAPKAEEKISYGMPYYGYKGRLVYFAYFKNHIGLYIMPRFLEGFEKEIEDYKTGRATLQISFDKKLPAQLIKKILKNAVKMIEEDS